MSTYQADSELSRFNQAAVGEPFELSEPTLEVLRLAQTVWRETEGVFDVSVGPLVNLWGFGPETQDRIPDEQAIRERMAMLGMDSLDVSSSAAIKRKPLQLDFSALAKGYATDRVAERLETMGILRYMVEIGGELRVGQAKPNGQPWWIGVEKPVEGEMGFAQITLPLISTSIATSGDYRNYLEQDGRRYSHIINPKTGYPVQHQVASSTVLHASNAVADAYATAFMVLSVAESLQVAERLSLAVYLLERTEQGFKTHVSSAFAAMPAQ